MFSLKCFRCGGFVVSFLLVLFAIAHGQDYQYLPDTTSSEDPHKILAIILQGNEKTKDEIILREMTLKVGDRFDPMVAERDRLRIQNLGIFNRVEIDMVPTSSGVILVVSVYEMWYLWPYPIIFRNERDWSRISVGAGLLHTNFRGRREIIDFSFWIFANPSIRLRYTNPWIFGKLKFYTSGSFFARKVQNLAARAADSTLTENQIGFAWRIGKRFGHFLYIDASFGYKTLSFSRNGAGLTLTGTGKDKLPQIGLSLTYDKRDLWEYAHDGYYVSLWLRKTGFGGRVDYLRYGADLRYYQPIGPTTLGLRAAGNFSTGRIPIYDQVHLGFFERVRGHFNTRLSGENRVVGSAEFRFPIRKITYHDFGPFQSMGRYGSSFRFGVSGALFADTGAVWFQREKLTSKRFLSGWGAGLHFFLPYQIILRLEYAFNENWDGQVIFDVNASF